MNSDNKTASLSSFRSRWGYHVCDYAIYVKLKRLNHLVEQAKHLAAAQWRYDRKTVNQGARFVPIYRDGRRIGRRRLDAVNRPEFPLPYAPVLLGHRRRPSIDHDWVGKLYRNARTPHPDPVEALDADTVSRATLLLAVIEDWNSKR